MSDSFNKIINLIKKTGDKAIVLNEDGPAYVVMSFRDYENLINEKDLNRINREIAIQQAQEFKDDIGSDDQFKEDSATLPTAGLDKEEDKYYFESVE